MLRPTFSAPAWFTGQKLSNNAPTVVGHVSTRSLSCRRAVHVAQDQRMDTVCGTHHYLAPELVKCDRGEMQHSRHR